MATGFVYCWTDKKTNILYVGSHKGHIEDGYICSSKYMLEEYNKRPEDFSRQIVAEGNWLEMRILESKILMGFDVKNDDKFYNMHNSDGNFYLKFHTKESKKKISKSKTGKKRPDVSLRNKNGHSEETKKLISKNHHDVSGCNNPMFGKTHTEKVKNDHSKRMTGENNPNYNKKFSEDTKMKMSIARKKYWENKKVVKTTQGG